jgi:hypothetical protein
MAKIVEFKAERIFNGKRYRYYKTYGTMLHLRQDKKMLEEHGYSVRITSRGATASGGRIYRRHKLVGKKRK